MTIKFISSLILLFYFFNNSEIYEWGQTGHRVVAQIAQEYLNENTKDSINKILNGKSMTLMINLEN